MQHSPVSPKQYNSFQNSKKIILDKLLIIFTYYCGKASKYNYNELLSKSFMEMMAAIALTCGITLTRGMHMWVVIENVYHAKARKVTMDF